MAENFQSPAVIIRELRRGVPQIRGVPTSVGAMVVRTLRGAAGAVPVDSTAKAQRIYGGYEASSYAMESIDAFFKNGGSLLYLSRAIPTGGGGSNTEASVTIDTAASVSAATFTAVGPGSDYNGVKVRTSLEDNVLGLANSAIATAIPVSSAVSRAYSADDTALTEITSGVNDVTVANVTLFPASETILEDYVAFGFTSTFGKMTFDNTGGTQGAGGAVDWEYYNGTAWVALTGVTDGTSGFTAATGPNQVLTFTVPTDWAKLSLDGTEGLYYIRAKITTVYTTNPVYDMALINAIASVRLTTATKNRVVVGDTLKIADGTNTLRGVVKQIVDDSVVFANGLLAPSAPMTTALTSVVSETWTVSFLEAGRVLGAPFSGLRMSPLSLQNYFVTRINTGSEEAIATVADASPTLTGNVDNRPVNTVSGGDLMAGGETMSTYQDLDYIGALDAFDNRKDIRLVAIPGVTGVTTGAVSKALLDYCTNRTDCVAVMAAPMNLTPAQAVTYKTTNVGGTSFGIMYYPYVTIVSPLTSQKAQSPPEGYVMGMIARTDRDRNVAKAPAGEIVGRLAGTIDVERVITDTERGVLQMANINPIESLDGNQCVMGSRTMESGEFNQINVRRTFIYFGVSLKEGTRFVLFEPNDTATRARVRRTIAAFLTREWKRGNLTGDTLDEAFWVICDKSNNPEVTILAGQMYASTGVNIPKTTEILVIEIQQDQRGLEAELGF